MKNVSYILFIVSMYLLVACDTHNVLDDIGTTEGNTLSNVYMEALPPKIGAGSTVEMEVQYWSLDDQFLYTGLEDFVSVDLEYEITVAGSNYSVAVNVALQDWTEVKEYAFDFSNWTPESNAYVHMVDYTIDLAYDAVSVGDGDISADQFLASIPVDFGTRAFDYYTNALSRDDLNILMIDHGVMTQSEFDAQYGDNGSLTDDGKVAIAAGLEQIGLKTLMGDTYEIGALYEITLAFRVTNGTQISNESKRTFGVF